MERPKVRAFDLFCGAGGSSCGAKQAGAEIVGGVDLWPLATQTFQSNFRKAKTYTTSIIDLSPQEVLRDVGPINLLLASPECTHHSVAKGAKPRDEASKRLAFEILRFADLLRPRWVVVENVIQMQRWPSFEEWRRGLQDVGYHVRAFKLNAHLFGVPQHRRRLFVICDRQQVPTAPRPYCKADAIVDSILRDGDGSGWRFQPLDSTRRAPATLERAPPGDQPVRRSPSLPARLLRLRCGWRLVIPRPAVADRYENSAPCRRVAATLPPTAPEKVGSPRRGNLESSLMTGRPWTREETLAALNLYCRTPFGRLHARNPEIVSLARAIGRTPGSVAMKCCNLASFDPAQRARGIRGLSKASHLDEVVWEEFHQDTESVGYESEVAFARLTHQEPRVSESVEWEDVQGLDRQVITKVRVNQHLFRSMILAGYRNECAVCGIPMPSLLVASHIVRWSLEKTERMNPHNGICLCALHDRAYDAGILVIKPDYRITIVLPVRLMAQNPAVEKFLVTFEGKTISLPDRWHPDPALLERHSSALRGGAAT